MGFGVALDKKVNFETQFPESDKNEAKTKTILNKKVTD